MFILKNSSKNPLRNIFTSKTEKNLNSLPRLNPLKPSPPNVHKYLIQINLITPDINLSMPSKKQISTKKPLKNTSLSQNDQLTQMTPLQPFSIPTTIPTFSSQIPSQNDPNLDFLERQLSELVLTEQPKAIPFRRQAKEDPKITEEYLKFKYLSLPCLGAEEDLINVLRKAMEKEKSVKNVKIRKMLCFFVDFFFDEMEVDSLFQQMYSTMGENQWMRRQQKYTAAEKKSLIKESLERLLMA